MPQKSYFLSAAAWFLPFFALAGVCIAGTLSGCGGGSETVSPNPSPSVFVPVGEPGRGGALSDGCSRAGAFITQLGWSGQCSTAVQPTRKWTVLLYMNGANNLEEYGNLNLNQIERFGSDANITFVAQFKRIPESAHAEPLRDDKSDGDWTETRRYVVRRDNDFTHVSSPIIASRKNVDMGSKETLQEFIQWGVKTFPAERYAIVLWNHGAGWRSQKPRQGTRGVSYDDETGTHIETIEFAEAITLGNDRKWDLVAWDSSLMQMMEVAYEIKDQTNWIVGSEESPPAQGYPYDRWVDKLIANPDADGRFVGEAICDAMITGYPNDPDITESLLDASKIAPLASAVNSFGASLSQAKDRFNDEIQEAREESEYMVHEHLNKDLLDFARITQQKVSDPDVRAAAVQVEAAVRAAVVKNVRGSNHPNAEGIAIYIPSPGTYRRDDIIQANGFGQRYTELLFARDAPNWQSFLTQTSP
ncbi:MAG: hypothetical protein H8F28_17095 [Fibrella sp.]|nr:hypothetical protein [Armatimonadota bacterium]